ncbi:MAG TPA: hypothetical protein ENK15_00045 [Thermopetrobacter sp.]|nr:hypothetical protein [Thermopetrobacter sp.]
MTPRRRVPSVLVSVALALKALLVLVWLTMAVAGWIWFSAAARAGIHPGLSEIITIALVFAMSLVVWWWAGRLAGKHRRPGRKT